MYIKVNETTPSALLNIFQREVDVWARTKVKPKVQEGWKFDHRRMLLIVTPTAAVGA